MAPLVEAGFGNTSNLNSKTLGKAFGQEKATVQNLKTTAQHPLRDPFNTLMWLLPFGHGIGHVGLGAVEASDALRAGDVRGAARALKEPSLLKAPRSLTAPGGEPVSLAASKNALRRLYQQAHDTYVQHQMNTNPEGIVAKYGASRLQGSLAEVSRAKVRYRQAIVANLRKASQPVKGEIVKAAKTAGLELQNSPKTIGQAAIELVSHNTTPEEATLRAQRAIEQGVNPELNAANVRLYHEIDQLGLIQNHGLHLTISDSFPRTQAAENILNRGATSLDTQITSRNLRPEEQLAQRRDLPAAVTQRLKPYEQERITPALRTARDTFERVNRLYQKALDQEAAWRNGTSTIKTLDGHRISRSPGSGATPDVSNPFRDRVVALGMKHEEALARVRKLEARAGVESSVKQPITEDLRQAVSGAKEPDGGFTLRNDFSMDKGEEGHVVALAPYEERVPAAELTPERVAEYAAKHRAVLEGDPSLRIGGWHNPEDGNVYLDISRVVPTREEAMSLAREHGQLSVFDRGAYARGDMENAFPSSGLSPAEADVVKSAARARVAPDDTVAALHEIPETVAHEALNAIRESMPELLQRKFELRYGNDPERFAKDMLGVAKGEIHDPEAVRMFHQLTSTLEGRSFTPLKTLVDQGPNSPMARSQGPVVGLTADPLESHFTTGKGLLEGRHQEDVVDAVARHWHNVFRFFNTQDWRNIISKTGSDVRRSSRDILVREDNRTEGGAFQPKAAGDISAEIEKMIGRKRDTAYTPQMEGEDAGVLASVEEFVRHLFPGRDPNSAEAELERTAPEGAKAPAGYKWVDSETARVDDLVPRMPATGLAKHVGNFFDNMNAAVTAATVYFKLGHFGTRYLTNAATNIMQGSAGPLSIKSALDVWHELTPEERTHALATAGTHYYEALPGAEGEGRISRMIQHGVTPGSHALSPQWWAGYVDSPFRFNSLAYEVRKSAFGEGVDGMRSFLKSLDDYNNLDPAQRAEVDGVVRRANREAIAYDRMNDFEKRYLARAIWFYPWVKGSTVWTASALFEHPFKAAAGVQLGVQGREEQAKEIGDLPSYSYGVFLLTHGKLPLAADFSTFNPAGTAGDVLQIPSHANDLAGMLNPALGAAEHVATSTNEYDTHTNHPVSDALRSLVSATPESQVLSAINGEKGDQSHREYPAVPGDPFSKTPLGEILRGLIGPGAPRRFNPEAAHSLAKRERTGK